MSYTAAEAVKVAKSQVGKRETGTNDTPYNRWLGTIPGYPHGGYGYPWCMSYQSWVASKAGGAANTGYPKTAGCAVAVAWFRDRNRWSGTPHVGDMVFYGPGGGTHVELVVAVSGSTITTVGGNTGGTLNGAYHEGNGVYQKTVARSASKIYGYGRPVYAAAGEEDDMATPDENWNRKYAQKNSPVDTWQMDSILANNNARLRDIEAKVDALAAKADVDVDEPAIVAGVLAGLAPDDIAQHVVDALPADLAGQVLDGLRIRLEA